MNGVILWVLLLLIPVALILGAIIGYLIKQNQVAKEIQRQTGQASNILEEAKEEARQIELQARARAF